jgi:PTS system fructose-specific IIC component
MSAFGRFFRTKKSKKGNETSPGSPAASAPVEIHHLLSSETITIFSTPMRKSELLQHLVDLVCAKHPEIPRKRAFQSVMEREKVTSTFMDTGVAVPHARLPELKGTPAALGVIPAGFVDAALTSPIHYVFLFFSPEGEFASHLQLLARASWLFQNPALRSGLLQAKTPADVLLLIKAIEQTSSHGTGA